MFSDFDDGDGPSHFKIEKKVFLCVIKIRITTSGSNAIDFKLSKDLKFSLIAKILLEKLEFKITKRLRLFTYDGVEVMEDDLFYLKDDSKLFATKGEDFDPYSSFCDYEIKEMLGEGGFGKVYKAIHKETNEIVAIKFVNASLLGTAQDIDMIFREAELLKSLNHKNIVNISNCYTLSNMEVAFVMEYLEGGELLEYVTKKKRLEESEARSFFKQIIDAIGYCHKEKLIHRDLKLENILLADKEGKVIKVVDFGIAGLFSNLSVVNKDAGSLRYLAPEILSRKNNAVTPAVDVWALGCILFGMVTGELPFASNFTDELISSIIESKWDYPFGFAKKLSNEVKDLIKRILVADPQLRISVNDIYDHDWLQNKPLAMKYLEATEKEEQEERKKANTVIVPGQRNSKRVSIIKFDSAILEKSKTSPLKKPTHKKNPSAGMIKGFTGSTPKRSALVKAESLRKKK